MNPPTESFASEDDGNSAPPIPHVRSRSPALRPIEKVALFHAGSLLLLATWYFAGGSARAQFSICCWGSLAVLLTGLAWRTRAPKDDDLRRTLHWLWPVLGFNLFVLGSCLNPSFSEKFFGADSYLAATGASHPALPSTAHVATSLRRLWLFDALYLPAFNLALIVRRRRALRSLLIFATVNATVLAVFGTLQKLLAKGIFFGAVPSPNPRFFATFVYGNHWAAFVVLVMAATIGLVFHYLRRDDSSPRVRSLILNGLIALVLMAMTPLIAGSRAGTAMAALLLIVGGVRTSMKIWRRQRALGQLAAGPLTGMIACGVVAVSGAIWLGSEMLEERVTDTREQLQSGDPFQGRSELYRDTWTLAAQEPAFGWGLGTYSKVFMLVRPRPLEANRQYERSYADAHSDWLQAVVEVGFVGTFLIALIGYFPLRILHAQHFNNGLTTWALGGCLLILLYATVEFPFGNAAVVLMWWISFFCAIQNARLRDAAVYAARMSKPREE